MLEGLNIYLFAPNFFSYDKAIKESLEKKSATVNLFDERPFASILGKAILRLNLRFLINKHIEEYYDSIILPNINKIDYLVFISPESITKKLLKKYKSLRSDLKIIVYMWDSLENKKNAYNLHSIADDFFTFDPNDASRYNLKFLPLFYIKNYEMKPNYGYGEYDFCFIGTAHSERYSLVKKITNNFKNTYYFFYTPNKLVFFYKKIILKELSELKLKDISFKSLQREDVVNIIKKSSVVIDINHNSQVGLTMRTIEMLGSNRKMITTNSDILNYDFYLKNNILLFNEKTTYNDIADFLNREYIEIDKEIYDRYSIDNWSVNLFSSHHIE